jgi:hypothetical protein
MPNYLDNRNQIHAEMGAAEKPVEELRKAEKTTSRFGGRVCWVPAKPQAAVLGSYYFDFPKEEIFVQSSEKG